MFKIPKFILIPFLLTTIIYWMSNLNNAGDRYILACVALIMIANCAVSFGVLISAIAPNSTVVSPFMILIKC